jgi:hypothetical protein
VETFCELPTRISCGEAAKRKIRRATKATAHSETALTFGELFCSLLVGRFLARFLAALQVWRVFPSNARLAHGRRWGARATSSCVARQPTACLVGRVGSVGVRHACATAEGSCSRWGGVRSASSPEAHPQKLATLQPTHRTQVSHIHPRSRTRTRASTHTRRHQRTAHRSLHHILCTASPSVCVCVPLSSVCLLPVSMTTKYAAPLSDAATSSPPESDFRAFCTHTGCTQPFSDVAYNLFVLFREQFDAASQTYWLVLTELDAE